MTNTTALAFTHSADCDLMALGRAVDYLRSVGERHALTIAEIDNKALTSRGRCDCGKLTLTRVENDLRLARKAERAYRNSPAFGSAEYSVIANRVESLIAQRHAIRAALA